MSFPIFLRLFNKSILKEQHAEKTAENCWARLFSDFFKIQNFFYPKSSLGQSSGSSSGHVIFMCSSFFSLIPLFLTLFESWFGNPGWKYFIIQNIDDRKKRPEIQSVSINDVQMECFWFRFSVWTIHFLWKRLHEVILCKRLAVQKFLWSMEVLIKIKLEHDNIVVFEMYIW